MRRVFEAWALVTVLLTAVIAACAPRTASPARPAPSGGQEDWAKIVAAAKKEGEVTIYHSGGFSAKTTPIIEEAWNKKYPEIKLNWGLGRGQELSSKLRAEHASKKVMVDVFGAGSAEQASGLKEGLLEKYVPPSVKDTSATWLIHPSNTLQEVLIQYNLPMLIVINTNLVKPGDEPKGWEDLANPKWKGKLIMDEPGIAGASEETLGTAWTPIFGNRLQEWVNGILANEPKFTTNYGEVVDKVARGEFAAGFPALTTSVAAFMKEGVPLKVIWAKEGTAGVIMDIAIPKLAPHPNAAKVYVDFIFTPEGQSALSKTGNTAIRKGIGAQVDWLDVEKAGIKLFAPPPDRVSGMDARALRSKTTFKR